MSDTQPPAWITYAISPHDKGGHTMNGIPTRIIQCMKTRGEWTCALRINHRGVHGYDTQEAREAARRDEHRRDNYKIHRADPGRN